MQKKFELEQGGTAQEEDGSEQNDEATPTMMARTPSAEWIRQQALKRNSIIGMEEQMRISMINIGQTHAITEATESEDSDSETDAKDGDAKQKRKEKSKDKKIGDGKSDFKVSTLGKL